MNGLLTLFIVSVIAQAGEILPEPNRTGPAIPVSAPVYPPVATGSSCTVGWGKDPDGIFCMIMQISPEAIATFAQGEKGQELPVDIPPEIRQQIQRVIVRVGTGPVEKNPPNPQLMSSARDPTNTVPFVANAYSQTTVDNRSPVSIDMPPRSTEVLPTGGGGQLGLQQLGNPPTANFGSDPNSGFDAFGKYVNSNPGSNQGSVGNGPMANGPTANGLSTNGLRGNGAFPSSMNNAVEFMPNTTGATQNYNSNDGFQPAPRTSTNFLRGAAGNGSGTGSGIGYGTSGNSYQPSPSTYNPSNPSNPNPNQYATGTNYQPNNSAFNNRGTIPRVATNPANGPLNFNEGNSIMPSPLQSGFQTNPSPSLSQMQQYTQSQPPTPNQYASAPYYSSASAAPWGSPALTRQPQQPPLGTDPATLEPASKDKLVPFLLLFSIVGNVYLGLWMGHLRTKYRQLLSNMRGVPVSDLDG
ncbi:MAG: hypothetical protein NTU79_23035 [Planctomycetota bacterium]|nr:hypothetical protein [Planctomycetota bacterium]